MSTEESQAYAAELKQLAERYPRLSFADRQKKKKPCKNEWLRFQAVRPVFDIVESPAIYKVRDAFRGLVEFKLLVAWAATPRRLADILSEKGVR